MNKVFAVLLACILVVGLASCAPGSNELRGSAPEGGKTAGFWQGVWHGMIAPISFVVSLFNKAVNIYEVRNSGNWYNFGFILGLSVSLGGGGAGGASGVRKRRNRAD